MPLKKGKSKKVVSENIKELKSGEHHKKMAEKYGEKKADEIDVAIALSKKKGK